MKLEVDFAKFKTIQKFDSLIKRVGSDIDKKSTFSKKLQNEHKKEQDIKTKNLVDKVSKADDIFTVTTKESTRDFFGTNTKKPSTTFNLTRAGSRTIKKKIPKEKSSSPVLNEYTDHG